MSRTFLLLAAVLAATPAGAQTLTPTARSAGLALTPVWAGQSVEGPCPNDWFIVESRGTGVAWYCMRPGAQGEATVHDWGLIDGGTFDGRLLRPPVPGDRRLLLEWGGEIRGFDPVTRATTAVATLPPLTTVRQPPMRMDRDGSGRNQLALTPPMSEPIPVIALPGAAATPWQVVATGIHPLLRQ